MLGHPDHGNCQPRVTKFFAVSHEPVRPVKVKIEKTVITPDALERIGTACVMRALLRHSRGDWGEVDEHDRQANEAALKDGTRLLSVYRTADGMKFWVITEADRSATTILLPEEY